MAGANRTLIRSRCSKEAASTNVEAAIFLGRLLLLLALVIGLRRMIMSGFGFFRCLSLLLLCTHMIVTAVLLRCGSVSLRGLLMMIGGLLVHFLGHW
jgi:hypothetical protein